MTLENLKHALYLNNEILLQIKDKDQIDLMMKQIALLSEEKDLLLEAIIQLSEQLDVINRTVIT